MRKSVLSLEPYITNENKNTFRTVFKTQHGRVVFLSLEINGNDCTITDCFYMDRNQGRMGVERYSARPLKLQTLQFPTDNLLSVIETELDKKFYGVEFIQTNHSDLSLDQYLRIKSEKANTKYHFLIMVGDGEEHNGLPMHLRTRLKNKLHRSVFIELEYYKDGNGVVKQCYFYDREYKRQDIKVMPPQLISCFFLYTNEGIINLLNHEICCDFTHILVTNGIGIDLDSDLTPLCGAV